jgi:hypothetical protein
MGPIIAPFGKSGDFNGSLKRHHGHLRSPGFCHVFPSIRALKLPQESEYAGRFFIRLLKKTGP